MRRALILDRLGKEIITVNDEYSIINILIPEKHIKGVSVGAINYQIEGKELLKELHKFIGNVIQNNSAIINLKSELEDLQKQQQPLPSESKDFKTISEKINIIKTKYSNIIKR